MELADQAFMIAAVFGCLAITILALGRKRAHAWLARRQHGSERGFMVVAGRLVLTPQHMLHLVRIGERTLLIATHPQGAAIEPIEAHFPSELSGALARNPGGRP